MITLSDMTPSTEYKPPPALFGRATLGDGRTVRLASPFRRLAARVLDTLMVVALAMLVVGAFSNARGNYFGAFADDWCDIGHSSAWPAWWCPTNHKETATHENSDDASGERTGDAPQIATNVESRRHDAEDADGETVGNPTTEAELWVLLVLATGYELCFLLVGKRSSSPGRLAAGIDVVRAEDGSKLRWYEALQRWSVLGIAFAMMILLRGATSPLRAIAVTGASGATLLFSATRQAWHDAIAGTVVAQRSSDDVWWRTLRRNNDARTSAAQLGSPKRS